MNRALLNFSKLFVSLALIYFLLRRTQFSYVAQTFRQAEPGFLLLAFLLGVMTFLISARRWQLLLRPFHDSPETLTVFRLLCLSRFLNVFVPGSFVGEIARVYKTNSPKFSWVKGLASVSMDKIMGLAGFVIVGVGALCLTPVLYAEWKQYLFIFLYFLFALAVIFVWLYFRAVKHSRQTGFFYKVMTDFSVYGKYLSLMLWSLLLSVILAVLNILIFYSLAQSLRVTTPGLAHYLFFIPLIHLVSSIPVTYGGLGLREGAFIVLFTHVGMQETQALSVSLLYFGLIVLIGLIGGGIYLLTEPSENKTS